MDIHSLYITFVGGTKRHFDDAQKTILLQKFRADRWPSVSDVEQIAEEIGDSAQRVKVSHLFHLYYETCN